MLKDNVLLVIDIKNALDTSANKILYKHYTKMENSFNLK